MISAERIHAIVLDCLFREEEIVDGKPTSEPVKVMGIIHNLGFHAERLKSHEAEINDFLDQLPDKFHEDKGGGWSFLNMCVDKDEIQWGEHRDMEELVLLGIGIGRVVLPLPRAMWSVLPGGMPYVCIKKSVTA